MSATEPSPMFLVQKRLVDGKFLLVGDYMAGLRPCTATGSSQAALYMLGFWDEFGKDGA